MARSIKFTVLINLLTLFITICYAYAEMFNGVEFPNGKSSFADEWIEYIQGQNVSDNYNDPNTALGVPDYTNGKNAVSLGDQGVLTLKFTDNALTTSGDDSYDLWIFEVGNVIEPTKVEISKDGTNWIFVGKTGGGTKGIDIDSYLSSGVNLNDKYYYVKLTDLLPAQSTYPYAGADIDAVGAISSVNPVPISGTLPLLCSGMICFMAKRRKKTIKERERCSS